MPWGMFGENLSVEGLQEADTNIGDVFQIGQAKVQVTQPRQPCFKLEFRFHDATIVQKFVDSGYSGVYVRVLEKGWVKTGDSMTILEKKDSLSIQKVYELIYTDIFRKEAVEKAVNDPFIAASCRKDLLKRWKEHL
jgi:MOSC domain-containing protein YiiM